MLEGSGCPRVFLTHLPTSCRNSGSKKRDGFCTLPNALGMGAINFRDVPSKSVGKMRVLSNSGSAYSTAILTTTC
ncbi:hypothetical protein CDAR_47611 [Caerostris darwini]|uniref:Uncharacterized protein n=1 Tax=Caerostris darwini TaxID=1538125 RepID=A0AAV4M922_9ARAC|nr:hypothetical protein CDAR_47611 [Caerostris darwini]